PQCPPHRTPDLCRPVAAARHPRPARRTNEDRPMPSPPDLNGALDQLSALSTLVITSACAVHLFVFFILWMWARRDLRHIASSLFEFTRGLTQQSVLGSTAH